MQGDRTYTEQGDRAEQNELAEGILPVSFTGSVEHGRALGRTVGMPTANITPADVPEWLVNGVYLSRVKIWSEAQPDDAAGNCDTQRDDAAGNCETQPQCDGRTSGRRYDAISNFGRKPTVQENGPVNIETFIYDFDEDIYGREITVTLLEFIRPERRFDSFEELAKQLKMDIAAGRAAHGQE